MKALHHTTQHVPLLCCHQSLALLPPRSAAVHYLFGRTQRTSLRLQSIFVVMVLLHVWIAPRLLIQVPYVGRYLFHSSLKRFAGGQGVVQFARAADSGEQQFAIKFYTQFAAFSRERDLYSDPTLREMMPATQQIIGNEDRAIHMPDGYVFPPAIVIEKGESLDVWASRERKDFVTILQVLCHIAERLKVLHAAGWAHLDLKPGNVLRRPEQHSWTLIDFGCAARIGARLQSAYRRK
jgi:hypothetical protein